MFTRKIKSGIQYLYTRLQIQLRNVYKWILKKLSKVFTYFQHCLFNLMLLKYGVRRVELSYSSVLHCCLHLFLSSINYSQLSLASLLLLLYHHSIFFEVFVSSLFLFSCFIHSFCVFPLAYEHISSLTSNLSCTSLICICCLMSRCLIYHFLVCPLLFSIT